MLITSPCPLSPQNILDLALTHDIKVYSPSTIAVFGPTTPHHNTPDSTIKEPQTMYGITKVHQELLGEYYSAKLGVDYRSLRYPGIISAKSLPVRSPTVVLFRSTRRPCC